MNTTSLQDRLQELEAKIAQIDKQTRPRSRRQGSIYSRIALAAALFLIPVVAFGVTITKPYTFVGGQPISASELNANFDTVYDRVNQLGIYKAKAGSTVLGNLLGVASAKQVYFISAKGYVSTAGETSENEVSFGLPGTSYHISSDCSDAPILPYAYSKTVVNVNPNGSDLVYGTGIAPTAAPAYLKYQGGSCFPYPAQGTRTAYTTTAPNDESVTGIPNSATGSLSFALE